MLYRSVRYIYVECDDMLIHSARTAGHDEDYIPARRSEKPSKVTSTCPPIPSRASPTSVSPCIAACQTQLTRPFTVSGANRGIGYQLVLALLERQPDAIIFAGARDPASANELNDVASKHQNVHVVKLIADDEESNKKAVEEIKKVTDRLDVVVANAGKS
jgi:hypothetical protein